MCPRVEASKIFEVLTVSESRALINENKTPSSNNNYSVAGFCSFLVLCGSGEW